MVLRFKFNLLIPLLKNPYWFPIAYSIKFQFLSMTSKLSHDMAFYILSHISPGPVLPFCLRQCLVLHLHVAPRTCPHLFLAVSGLLILIILYLPFKIILASPTLKKPCLTSSFTDTFTELESSSVPPWYPVFALSTLHHNYSFIYPSSP